MREDEKSAYQNLKVWQKGMEFANAVIDVAENLESARKHYRLVEQLESAATSVPMNIAEGKGRHTKKEFTRFLYISRGSLYETMTLLELFEMRGWITNELFRLLEAQANEIAKMINGLIRSLSKHP